MDTGFFKLPRDIPSILGSHKIAHGLDKRCFLFFFFFFRPSKKTFQWRGGGCTEEPEESGLSFYLSLRLVRVGRWTR